MAMPADVFTLALKVEPEDFDRLGHINNVAFVQYIQDVAVAHWLSAAPPEMLSAVVWVVRRHEVEYLKPGLPQDSLTARTWVGEASGATWERFTEIVRGDGVVLVKARTVWVLLDATTGRPRRVDQRMTGILDRKKED
jgi:acyl-CoA thioester hydrolase